MARSLPRLEQPRLGYGMLPNWWRKIVPSGLGGGRHSGGLAGLGRAFESWSVSRVQISKHARSNGSKFSNAAVLLGCGIMLLVRRHTVHFPEHQAPPGCRL